MNLSEPFIRQPVMTVLLVVSATLFGVLAYRQLPVNDLPPVDYPVIQVQVNYPGATPETMANNVATPLEQQFLQIPALDQVTSASSQGHTTLTLQFALSKSLDGAATDVQAAITRATGQLPLDLPSPPTFTKVNPNDQPIFYIGLTSDSVTAGQLYDYAKIQVGQRISILPGVSQVAVFGTQAAVRIKADPSAMAVRGITIDDLTAAIRDSTSYQGSGQFDGTHRTFLLQPKGQVETAADYDDLIVGTQNGAPVYLKDLARSFDSVQDERIRMRFWIRGQHVPSATVVLAVFRQAGSNAVEVSQAVRALLPRVRAEIPGSVDIIPIHDRSETIVNSVSDVKETLVIAFVLVVAVIFMFLGRTTDTLIPAIAMPLSLLLVFVAMDALGYSLDNLSLMGLTLVMGFLVDDAIVFLENTVRRMEQFGEDVLQATLNSAKEISFTILSMTVSLAAVFIPLVFMSGLVGRIFREFSITIAVAVLASGIVSLTLTPMMCSRLLSRRGQGARKTWMERVVGGVERRVLDVYGRSLWWFLKHRWISACVWVICLAGTFWLFTAVPQSFLPVGDSSFIRGVMIAQEGSSPQQMYTYQAQAEEVMHANPAVQMTFTMAANNQFLTSNQGLLLAFLKDPDQREPIASLAGQMMFGVRKNVPGLLALLQPDPVLRISTGATATQQGKYAYAISGINPEEVYGAAGKLLARFMEFKGFATVSSDLFNHTPRLEIDILRDQAKTYGISATRILTLLRNAYSENYVYLIKAVNEQYQVILEVKDSDRMNPDDLALLYIRSDDGQRVVPLSAVATWRAILGVQAVNHINQFTSVTFFFNLNPDVSLGDATGFIEQSARQILPSTVQGTLQGEAQTFRTTVSSMVILMCLAIFVMYVILGILYESYLHPLTVLSSLPVALVGGLATLYLFGEEASLYAFIGMFMLMGIVKKNGILIVDFALQRISQGRTASEAIHDGSMDRFRPIMMTTLAAMMGAMPIAVGYGADGASRRPLGLVVVGGLIVSQFITLYVTPVIYLYLEQFQEKVLDRIPFFRSSRGHVPPPAAAALVGAVLLLFVAGGCNVGPDYHRPATTMPAAWGEQPPPHATTQPAQVVGWWKTFKDPVLDQLIGQAMAGNISFRQAIDRVREARAQRGVIAANAWPTIDANGNYERFRLSPNATGGGNGGLSSRQAGAATQPSTQPAGFSIGAQNLYQIGFDATWELDVFGKVRRGVEAADASVAAAVEDRRDVLVSLLAEVARNYIELRGFQQQLHLTQETLRSQRDTLALTRSRLEAGTVTDLDVAQAEAQVADTVAQLPPLETSVHQRMHQLSILTGREPMALSALILKETPIPSAAPGIPLGIPSDLLRQRADIRRAERQLASATAQIGVAVADLFPQFTLTGNVGYESLKIRTLTHSNSLFWNFGPNVSWPVFEGGSIRANIRVRNAQQQEAAAAYEQAVLTALGEVEDALVAYSREQTHRQALADSVEANRRALDLSTMQYMHGRADFLSVLVAQRTLYTAQNALVVSDQTLSTDLVTLYKALGGGWDGLDWK